MESVPTPKLFLFTQPQAFTSIHPDAPDMYKEKRKRKG